MMKLNIKPFLFLGCLLTLLSACGGTEFDDPVEDQDASAGDLDLSRYVALGDSLTAGFKDRSLYIDGQLDSFPNILAQQFAEAGGGAFSQPLVADNLGGLLASGDPIADAPTRLVLTNNVEGDLVPINQPGTPTTEIGVPLSGAFNNMGVPGAKSFHLVASSYGDIAGLSAMPATANPFAVYFGFAANTDSTILAEAVAQAPTFFSLWIGNNDILDYATSGGDDIDLITKTATFDEAYGTIVNGLLAVPNVKGVLINVPAITDIPFFTTVPFNAIPLDADTAAAANTAYEDYNTGVQASVGLINGMTQAEADERMITFEAGQNAVVILDENLTDITSVNSALVKLRQATAADLIPLPLSSTLGTERTPDDPTSVIGVGSPLLDSEVLTYTEVDEIETARAAYNTTITNVVTENPGVLALYDAAAALADLNDGDGVSFGTGSINSTFATGGAFSLDGIHPTARGYAVIANGIIDTLNANFNANILKVDPGDYSEVFFEFPEEFDFSP